MPCLVRPLLVILVFALAACQTGIPRDALQLGATSLAERAMQTRIFEADERTMLLASAQLLQDLGFQIDESETSLGVIVASKNRDATEAGQVAVAIAVALLGGGNTPIDKEQKIRASVVTEKLGSKTAKVRVTFQRMVWNTQGQISRIEALDDPAYYQHFFDKLAQAVFLEAQTI